MTHVPWNFLSGKRFSASPCELIEERPYESSEGAGADGQVPRGDFVDTEPSEAFVADDFVHQLIREG
jgi:hypothetical protein